MKIIVRTVFALMWLFVMCSTGYSQALVYKTLHEAAQKGDIADVKRHLQKGANVNAKDEEGLTPLMYAACNGNQKCIRFITLKRQNLEGKRQEQQDASNGTAATNYLDIVKYLVDNSADVNARDNGGATPLKWATFGTLDIVKYLVDKGADVNARNVMDNTPLMWAAGNGNIDIVKYLVDKGADVNVMGKNDTTAMRAAVLYGHQDVIEFLKQHGTKEWKSANNTNAPQSER